MTHSPLSPDLALAQRDALPEALRVLVQQYPREGWDTHKNFSGLVLFWLDRHMMFRRMLERMTDETAQVLDSGTDPQRYSQVLARLGSHFVGDLHGHHSIEDQHYFPTLAAADDRISQGFDLLEKDHQSIDGLLNRFVESANGVLQAKPPAFRDKAASFSAELAGLTGLLNRHLLDEEDLIVPVILHYGPERFG